MRLMGSDGMIEISRGSFEDPIDLDVRVVAGRFAGATNNIFPSNSHDFLRDLESMEQFRYGRACLLGSEEFLFSVEWRGDTGGFWIEVQISQFAAFKAGHRRTQNLTVLLPIDGEYWSTMKAEWRAILSAL